MKKSAIFAILVLVSAVAFGQATPRPKVTGAVFGGGRMADVNGSTLVTVVNCDTIGAVFGGNDVAGEVKCGADPVIANDSNNRIAQVVVGVAATTGKLAIGSVYGGGNGYYYYPGIGKDVTTAELGAGTIHNYNYDDANPSAAGNKDLFTVASGLYVPQTVRTKITVNNNYAQIDSLFGGSKNAFITATTSNSTDITLRGGTIYAVFGGNNYGGTLGEGSTQNILVKATKTDNTSSVNLGGTKIAADPSNSIAAKGTAWTSSAPGTVAGHGIRYLFGGGNAAYAPQASITVNGGQIDTLFAGGNAATVGTSTVTVDVASPLYTIAKSPYYEATDVTPYNESSSVYDIRCLFGGNNAAAMTGESPSTVTLTQGGIHVVYGGGKQGEMNCGASYGDPSRTRSTDVQIASANILIDTVYGGGQSAGASYDTYVEMTNGKVGTIFGGTNIQGDIPATAKTFVTVSGGHVYESVFGGSNGCYLCLNYANYLTGETNHTIPSTRYDWLGGEPTPKVWNSDVRISGTAQVDGNVYGGGNLAPMGHQDAAFNSGSSETPGNTHVTISGGIIGTSTGTQVATGYDANDDVVYTPITGGVYGGANYANIYGYSTLEITGGIIYGDVFGGNDKTGTVTGSLKSFAPVLTTTTERPSETFAAGLPLYSDLNTTPTMTLTRSQTMGASYVRVTGTPQIHGSLFGGGNGNYNYYQYDVDGVTKVDVTPSFMGNDPSRPSALKCGNPSLPNQSSALVDLHMSNGAWINRVFAGGNYATVGVNTYQDGSTQIAGAGEATVWFNSADATPAQQVGTLFGGNNMVAMDVVPQLYLLQGRVGYVYGGGNQGNMTADADLGTAYTLSTYVGLASANFKVDQNVYGGCNAADVENESYVYVSRGTVDGHIFGGCDAAGQILTNTRVLVKGDETSSPTLGGNIYGGGNGNYPFYRYDSPKLVSGDPNYNLPHTKPYYIAEHRNDPILYGNIIGRPYCNETYVTIQGTLTLNGNVYGGGVSGDCRETNVLIDAENGDFNGLIFGAGQGRVNNTGLRINSDCHDWYIAVAKLENGVLSYYDQSPAMGNVLETANLTINRFKSMAGSRSTIFGGGESGNVKDVEVQYNATATAHLGSLYAGCLASDVTGRAHMVIGDLVSADAPTIDTVYGGNDFTGKVNETYVEINSGTYQHVFGAGNGDYDYLTKVEAWATDPMRLGGDNYAILHKTTCNCYDTVPYSMKVRVDFNGGDFLNTVYGGGNMGLVGDRDMIPSDMESGDADRDDYIGDITVNIHGGEFHRHVFTGARGKAEMTKRFFNSPKFYNDFVPDEAIADIPDAELTALETELGHAPSDDEKEAYLKSGKNIDGGMVGKQLAYAFKVLNMDGGRVRFSVYGGSEAVDDGYPYECIGKRYDPASWYDNDPVTSATSGHQSYDVNTTKRPSSVLNIIGGEIEKSVYGGGYQGNIYGSVYVNIGVDAVNDSPVWGKTVNGVNYSQFKPNLVGASGTTTTQSGNVTLVTGEGHHNLTLEASVYNASDWGEAGDKAYFNTRGVFGGETNILVDGKGYNTSQTNTSMMTLPGMLINYSIIGAGTSTEGGDINRLITVRHYGDFVCPDPSKTLSSIQRADKVILDSVFIRMEGEQDAYMAYVTPNYSFCRIDTLLFRIDNVVMSGAPAIYIGNLASLKDNEVVDFSSSHLYQNIGDKLASENEEAEDLLDNLDWNTNAAANCETSNYCHDPSVSLCDKISTKRGEPGYPGAFNTFIMSNGSYVKISPYVDKNGNGRDDNDDPEITSVAEQHTYGVVHGWMYMMAQDQTLSYAYARQKTASEHTTDGGFVSTCYCENTTGEISNEVDYTNVTDVDIPYRSWERGTEHGDRTRHITLVANAHPDNTLNFTLPTGDYDVNLSDGTTIAAGETGSYTVVSNATHSYAYAKATLELPPAKQGNFYLINSVSIDQDNGGQLQLTDEGYEATTGTNGVFFRKGVGSLLGDMEAIAGNTEGYKRDYTFGLTFAVGDNFVNNGSCWLGTDPDGDGPLTALQQVTNPQIRSLYNSTSSAYYPCWPISGISGSAYLEDAGGFISPAIGAGVGVIPTLNFTLTYDTRISTTITRDVVFTLLEYDKFGNYVGPVDVTVTISTVIKEFDDLEAPVMAMYNEGISNEYVRRITIPAAFLQRDIYLEGISWEPNSALGAVGASHFSMQDTNSTITNNKVFSLSVHPTESTSENLTSHLGWYNIETTAIDVYETALNDYKSTTSSENFTAAQKTTYSSFDFNADGSITTTDTTKLRKENGRILLGTLDGRASAGVDVSLKFDGMRVYYDHYDDPLAYVTLHMRYKNTKLAGEGNFDIKIIVRSRKEGDTIYMAPESTLTRTVDGTELTMYAYNHSENDGVGKTPKEQSEKIRNNPDCFVNTLREAMSIYREGDVIDIMETIPVTDGSVPTTVAGDDFSIVQIIRYSGSHYKFPTEACAHKGVMIEVKDEGILNMRNVWLNGSGCTQEKLGVPTSTVNPVNAGDLDVGGHTYHHNATYGNYQTINGLNYFEKWKRTEKVLFSDAPILYVHGKGSVNFSSNVLLTNNINQVKSTTTDAVLGGAIALQAKEVDAKPGVILGNKCKIYNNIIVDWNAAITDATKPATPLNWGAGVYVDGGTLTLGTGSAAASTGGTLLDIARNYYLHSNTTEHVGLVSKTKIEYDDADDSEHGFEFNVYEIDTLNHPQSFALSNIYLTRTAGTCPGPVRRDVKSDVVYFISDMSPLTRVGISKWFPGYLYDGDAMHVYTQSDDAAAAGYHRFYNDVPRDTVMVARLGKGKSNASMADRVYAADVFFNDSSYFSQTTGGTDPTFYQSTNEGLTTYSANTTDNPGYSDNVYMFHHSYLHQFGIYFQRCASFGKGVRQISHTCSEGTGASAVTLVFNDYQKGDSIAYRWNPEASCVSSTDTLLFRVGGGFFPYTYHWDYDYIYEAVGADGSGTTKLQRIPIRNRVTTGTNNISGVGTHFDHLRAAAECDTLVLTDLRQMPSEQQSSFFYVATAQDLTGRCRVTQPVIVRVRKMVSTGENSDPLYAEDALNYLRHRNPDNSGAADYSTLLYRVAAPGVDSSSFHDHEGLVPIHDNRADLDATGGLERAGYSHVTGYNYATGSGGSDEHVGLPYHDPQAAIVNGTDEVIYVDENGAELEEMTAANKYLYASEMVPRYLRAFRAYQLTPTIMPVAARGTVELYENSTATTPLAANTEFCPGDVVSLRPTPVSTNYEYMAWSHDPSSPENAIYVVSDNLQDPTCNKPVVYYSPSDYWYMTVTSFSNTSGASADPSVATLADYDLDYYGNVTIKTNKGLAWLISTVNGYNGQNAHTFHFNTITFDFDGDTVDMSAHKWTPLGNLNNHFEGTIVCGETVAPSGKQTVKGLIVNEKTLPRVGMFGYMEGATLSDFGVKNSQMKGNSYVGGLAAESKRSTVTNYSSDGDVLIGAQTIGGVIAKSDTCNVLDNIAITNMTMMGSAIEAGGIIGRAIGDNITNHAASVDISRLAAISFGGQAGTTSAANGQQGGKLMKPTVLHNNYVRIYTDNSNCNRVGGLVGNAEGLEMANCYAHGVAKGQDYVGGIAGMVGSNVVIDHCYYASDMCEGKTGYVDYGTPVQKSTSFRGKGKQVVLNQKVDGYNNMLRALNAWVNANGEDKYYHWRSAKAGENYDHPVFGDPEMIDVYDTTVVATCDSYEFEGMDFTETGHYVFHFVDSADYLDSTMTLVLTLHYSDSTVIVDTVVKGEDYDGYGYHFSSEQLQGSASRRDAVVFRYVDSLQTAYGCDSLVVLTLYILGTEDIDDVPPQLTEVKVYPNPTRGLVTVEGSDLQRVEVYDNISRRVLVRDVEGDRMHFDLSNQSSGAYYVRVKTASGTVVKKVIKK